MDRVGARQLIIKLNLTMRSVLSLRFQGAMYRHAKRDVHIFSEPRSQLKVNQYGVYSPSLTIPSLCLPSLLGTPYLTGAITGPPRKAPLNYHQTPERAQNRIGVYPQQLGAVIPSPTPVILDTSHFRYPLASADGVVFY